MLARSLLFSSGVTTGRVFFSLYPESNDTVLDRAARQKFFVKYGRSHRLTDDDETDFVVGFIQGFYDARNDLQDRGN